LHFKPIFFAIVKENFNITIAGKENYLLLPCPRMQNKDAFSTFKKDQKQKEIGIGTGMRSNKRNSGQENEG
jgi:hypothetical protein